MCGFNYELGFKAGKLILVISFSFCLVDNAS